ncbi:MAG: insulinase family protein [Deltaproteobacteria bacterium]|nr:insulinase family protein [Deltaproteobacteria bacterium]
MKTIWFATGLAITSLAILPAARADDDAAWRKARPAVPPPVTPVLPAFEQATLPNGLTILVTHLDALPVVTFNLVSKGGATYDPKGKAGLTSLTYDLLEEGAGELDALAFSDAVADLGADFGAAADRDSAGVHMGGLSRNADAMMKLLADAVIRPRLEAPDFERTKAQTIATLLRRRGSPQGLAFEKIPALIYGATHPYGHAPTGTPDTVDALTLDDVKAQYAKIMGPKHSALVVAGDLSLADAQALAEKHFGAWAPEAAPPPTVPEVKAALRKTVTLVDKPGAAQTMMVVGRPLFARGHKDEYALTLANEVFGGTFSARLNMDLREAKGYTYGASSQAAFRTGAGVFIAYSALRADVTAPGLKETMAQLADMKKKPPTEQELAMARSGLIRSLPGQFETTGAVAGGAASLFIYGLPLDHFATLGARYEAVSLDAVRKAAATYLAPATMQILLVGDRASTEKPVKALKLGRLVLE